RDKLGFHCPAIERGLELPDATFADERLRPDLLSVADRTSVHPPSDLGPAFSSEVRLRHSTLSGFPAADVQLRSANRVKSCHFLCSCARKRPRRSRAGLS